MPDPFLGAVLRHARRALARHAPTADAELLDRFVRERDESAFAALVARHGPGVWAACRRTAGSEADAEDAFQATFLVLARRANRVRRSASVGSWLFGVGVRLARKARARAGRWPKADRWRKAHGTDEPDDVAWREVVGLLDEELARLPAALRAPLLCCYYQGLTQDEAARQLGWKVRTLKARVDRGRKLVRARLARRGVDLSAALAAAAVASEGRSTPPAVVPAPTTSPPAVLDLTREGLAMTRSKTSLVLAACAAVLVAAGTGLVLGQGKPTKPKPPPAAPPTVATAKLDLAGDPLPPGAIARLGTSRFRAQGYGSESAVLFPDGRRAAWMDDEGTVKVWEVDTGRPVQRIEAPDLEPRSARSAVSPDGERLALLGNNRQDSKGLTVRLFDLKDGKSAWTSRLATVDRSRSQGVAFSPNGKRLIAAGEDFHILDAATGAEIRRQPIVGGFNGFALSPDRTTVAAGRADVWLWDWESNEPPRKVDREPGRTDAARAAPSFFAPDGKRVGVCRWKSAGIAMFNTVSGKPAGVVDFGGSVAWVSPGPDGKTVAVPDGQQVVLRDWATGKELRRLATGTDYPPGYLAYSMARAQWSQDGARLMSRYGNGQRLWVWDTATGKQLGPTVPGHEGWVTTMVFASDGRLYSAADDPTVRTWDPATGKLLGTLKTSGLFVVGLAVAHDGAMVAASGLHDDVRIWDVRSGKLLFRLLGHGPTGGVRKLEFSADDQMLVSFGDDGYVRRWDTLTGKLKAEHRIPGTEPDGRGESRLRRHGVALAAGGDLIAIATRGGTVLYATDTGKVRLRLDAADSLCVSPDGKRLAGVTMAKDQDDGDAVTVWDLTTGKPVSRFRAPAYTASGACTMFSPDGSQLATPALARRAVDLWDVEAGRRVATIDLPHRAEALAFDPPGKRLVVGFLDTTALVYDLAAALKPAKGE